MMVPTMHCAARPAVRCMRSRQLTSSVRALAGAATTSTWPHAPVVVVGAGIGGLATALALHKLGIPVRVLEAAPELRTEGAALALWSNAFRALEALGVAPEVRGKNLLITRTELCRDTGRVLRAFDFSEASASAELRGMRRTALLTTLLEALPPGTVSFGTRVTGVSEPPSAASAASPPAAPLRVSVSGGPETSVEAGLLVGADGVRSAVARHLKVPAQRYCGYVAYRGMAVFDADDKPVPAGTVRQVWGTGVRAGLYPVNETEYYWYTCFNAPEGLEGPSPSDPEAVRADALASVSNWSWRIPEAIRRTPLGTISRSRIADRWVRGAFGQGRVTLVGDAAHPMTPNLGQGGCAALEDAVVLGRSLYDVRASWQSAGSLEGALRKYEEERSRRCLPLAVRSNLMGTVLQLPFEPVTVFRDWFVSGLFSPSHFLDHTMYDCGTLTHPGKPASAH